MSDWFHVTSSRNRDSIRRHGLDWTRMGVAPGIAGSAAPEQNGCFLCRGKEDVEFFLAMNNTGGPADVWAVAHVDESRLVESPEGFPFVPAPVPPTSLTLVREDVARTDPEASEATESSLTGSMSVTFKSSQPKPD